MRIISIVSCFLVMCFTSSASADFWSSTRDKIEKEGGRVLHQIEGETNRGWHRIEKGGGIIAHQIEAEVNRSAKKNRNRGWKLF